MDWHSPKRKEVDPYREDGPDRWLTRGVVAFLVAIGVLVIGALAWTFIGLMEH